MGLNYKSVNIQKALPTIFLSTILLLNHVAFQFNWTTRTKVFLRAVSILYSVAGLSYLIYTLYV